MVFKWGCTALAALLCACTRNANTGAQSGRGHLAAVPASSNPERTLVLPQLSRVSTLDPVQIADVYTSSEVAKTYEPLYQYHYLKRPYVLEPLLAQALPKVSADQRVYEIPLKKGVFFHEDSAFGAPRELTAEDVVYSWKRIADPQNSSKSWAFLAERIVGLDEWRDLSRRSGRANYAAEVVGLRATDRYTVRVELTRPLEIFLKIICMEQFSIVAREVVEKYGTDFAMHPVGTGPFYLLGLQGGNSLVWQRNPKYRRELYPTVGNAGGPFRGALLEAAGKPIPFVDRVVSKLVLEPQPRWLHFQKGELDLIAPPKDAYSQAFALNKDLNPELKNRGIQVVKLPLVDIAYLTFNLRDPLLGANLHLRKALSLAINQNEYNRIFYNDRAIAAQGPIPPDLEGHDAQFKNPLRAFNLVEAKKHLAAAGFPEGRGLPALRFATVADSDHRLISEFLIQSFGALGVKLEVQAYQWTELMRVMQEGRTQLSVSAWVADYPDAETFLQLFLSRNHPPNGQNFSFYKNSEFDRLYEESQLVLGSGEKRAQIYRKMTEILTRDAPKIWLSHRLGTFLFQPWLKNYFPHHFMRGAVKYYDVDVREKNRRLGGSGTPTVSTPP